MRGRPYTYQGLCIRSQSIPFSHSSPTKCPIPVNCFTPADLVNPANCFTSARFSLLQLVSTFSPLNISCRKKLLPIKVYAFNPADPIRGRVLLSIIYLVPQLTSYGEYLRREKCSPPSLADCLTPAGCFTTSGFHTFCLFISSEKHLMRRKSYMNSVHFLPRLIPGRLLYSGQ